ncbi:MAG TPA: hypothetical protein VGI45_30560 [Terracidiphilus sp.]|jgi:hypothetical protein
MDWSQHRARLAIIAVAVIVLMIFAIRDARMGSVSFDPGDFLIVIGIYGVPFLVFAFTVWTGRWSDLKGSLSSLTTREKIALAAETSGVAASGMFVLNLPLWTLLASHESFGASWVMAGVLMSIVTIVCALAGSPRLWRHAIASALLLPFWVVDLGLLLKAMMD